MRDSNTAVLKAYYSALSGITYNTVAVPVYSGIVPDNINPPNYILFGEINNNDLSTKNSSDTTTQVKVTIHTFDEKYQTPKVANSIAGQVLNNLYPNTQYNLTLDDDLQMFSTELVSDQTNTLTMDANRAYIDRTLIFKHKIYHR